MHEGLDVPRCPPISYGHAMRTVRDEASGRQAHLCGGELGESVPIEGRDLLAQPGLEVVVAQQVGEAADGRRRLHVQAHTQTGVRHGTRLWHGQGEVRKDVRRGWEQYEEGQSTFGEESLRRAWLKDGEKNRRAAKLRHRPGGSLATASPIVMDPRTCGGACVLSSGRQQGRREERVEREG